MGQLKDARATLESNEIVSNQVRYNLSDRGIEEDLIPYCKSEKITVVVYSPLNGHLGRGKDRLLDEIASQYGKTRAQVTLNFLTREDNVVAIAKANNPEHVRENCGASGWRLSKEDVRRIEAQ